MSCDNRPWTFGVVNFSKPGHLSRSFHTLGLGKSEGWLRPDLQPIHSCNRIHISWMDTFISMAEQEHRAKRAPTVFVNPAVSHLQVSKPEFHAASTWSLLAKVSPISSQASLASVKFSCSFVFLVKRVTPIILHCTKKESSAKESHTSSVCCYPCSQPFGFSSQHSIIGLMQQWGHCGWDWSLGITGHRARHFSQGHPAGWGGCLVGSKLYLSLDPSPLYHTA